MESTQKLHCAPVEEMRALVAPLHESMPENTIPQLQKGTVECGICLQYLSLANPVILPKCIERDPETAKFLHAKATVLAVKGGHTAQV